MSFINSFIARRIYKQKYQMPRSLPLLEKVTITFYSSTIKAQLKQPVDSLVEASYSTVLSLANFLLHHQPSLRPPNYLETCNDTSQSSALYPQPHLTYNKLYEPWCDYLSELFLLGKVSQSNKICYLHDIVSEDFINELNPKIFLMSSELDENLNQSSNKNTNEGNRIGISAEKTQNAQKEKKKKIGIVNFALSQLRTDFVKPKMHLIGLFTGIFYNQGDEWAVYNVLKRQYPSIDEYENLDTIILSGSSLSVNDQTPQVVDFVQTLKEAVRRNPKLKILGICFGHQVLAKMFGGKIVQKKLLTGVQRIHFDQKLINQTPYFRRSQLKDNTFELSQYHKDFVVEIPQNFSVFAQSQTCKIESLISNDMRYLSFQFHPEYSAEYIKGFEMRLEHYQVFDLKSSYSHTERGSIRHKSSLWEIRKIMRNFLDWEVPQPDL